MQSEKDTNISTTDGGGGELLIPKDKPSKPYSLRPPRTVKIIDTVSDLPKQKPKKRYRNTKSVTKLTARQKLIAEKYKFPVAAASNNERDGKSPLKIGQKFKDSEDLRVAALISYEEILRIQRELNVQYLKEHGNNTSPNGKDKRNKFSGSNSREKEGKNREKKSGNSADNEEFSAPENNSSDELLQSPASAARQYFHMRRQSDEQRKMYFGKRERSENSSSVPKEKRRKPAAEENAEKTWTVAGAVFRFVSREEVEEVLAVEERTANGEKCKFCPHTCAPSSPMPRHLQNHHPFRCETCLETFVDQAATNDHRKNQHAEYHRCVGCDRKYRHFTLYAKHITKDAVHKARRDGMIQMHNFAVDNGMMQEGVEKISEGPILKNAIFNERKDADDLPSASGPRVIAYENEVTMYLRNRFQQIKDVRTAMDLNQFYNSYPTTSPQSSIGHTVFSAVEAVDGTNEGVTRILGQVTESLLNGPMDVLQMAQENDLIEEDWLQCPVDEPEPMDAQSVGVGNNNPVSPGIEFSVDTPEDLFNDIYNEMNWQYVENGYFSVSHIF